MTRKMISLRLPARLIKQMDRAAAGTGMTRTDLIIQAILEFLERLRMKDENPA